MIEITLTLTLTPKVLEVSCIRVMISEEWHYIVYLYNHPDNSWKDFVNEFKRFIVDTVPNIGLDNASPLYIVGDFNKDKKDVTEEHLKLFKEMKWVRIFEKMIEITLT